MTEASRSWSQLTLLEWDSGTSSPASPGGAQPSDLPVCPTTPASGPDPVRVSRSPTPVASAASPTIATSGPSGSGSSASAALQSSLASRLRVELAGRGSILYSLTWKDVDTPAGRRICQLQASALRTGDSGCFSWPTPTVADGTAGRETFHHGANSSTLLGAARRSAWPTPTVSTGDYTRRNGNPDEVTLKLSGVAKLAAWPTPDKMSGDRRGPADPNAKTRPSGHKVQFTINHAAATAAWPTPAARDWRSSASNKHGDNSRPLNEVARLTVAGTTATGSPAPTGSRGQLNPEHTRWLQGYPVVWGSCADTATRSSRRSRPRSSGRR